MLLAPPEDGIVHVWHFDLDRRPATVAACRAVLSAEERQRADRFVQPRDARRFAVARAGLRRALAAYAGADAAALRLGTGPHGKPHLTGPAGLPDLRFNLSHAGDRAALAVATGREVGIDIEGLRPLDDMDGLIRLVFAPAEQAAFAALPEAERLPAFLRCWTRKEAVLKALGRGLSLDPAGLSLGFGPAGSGPAVPEPVPAVTGSGPWSLAAIAPGGPLVGALAVAGPVRRVEERSWPDAPGAPGAACHARLW